uniref:Uncharacterized protein n=1 Tax=Euplotes crassus TaxID=5936 RepID=A0A7S3KK78_EUPCR|mmetsp:Transcript_32065/g.31465  ORF Transcript_32065/g.31465 Transcript_32065/m.31465 type:complete len:115 (+) Transcript_32065:214-558(+)
MTNVFQRGRILVNIQKLKQFIREERATLKHVKGMKAEQRSKSIFLAKMYNDTEQRKPKLPEPSKPNSNLVHLRTFNLPVKFPTNTQRGTRIPNLESTRKWKSSGKIIPLQGLKI